MRTIAEITEHIEDEIDDAHDYAMEALTYKDSCPELATVYYHLANDGLEHMNELHERVVALIKASDKEVPKGMQEVYEWQHERQIDDVANVRRLLDMFK